MTKILIVEDNELNRDMLSRRLIKKNYDIIMAFDGGAGIETAKRELPDLILMDLSLPIVDGWEATRRLKADPQARHIPIIALTAHAMASDCTKALDAGCDDYETKPVDLPKLLNKIEAQLERCRLLAEAEVESVEPVVELELEVEEQAEEPTLVPYIQPGESPMVLIVEDNPVNRDLLTRRVTREGYRVDATENGKLGLDALRSKHYDIILLDIMMPVMSGYELLDVIKNDPELKKIPVIMISAVDDMESIAKCLEMGAEDYLTKPFNPVVLRSRMSTIVEKKRLRDREELYITQLERERQRADEILRVILPDDVIDELKDKSEYTPRRYNNVAVLFCDVVGFTEYCDKLEPEVVVPFLQEIMEAFELISSRNGLQKIKTIGDSYMAVAGLLTQSENPVLDCIKCGLQMTTVTKWLSSRWQVRVGINCGPVVAGVVGKRQYMFDIWGDTVNTAARVERHSTPGIVCVSKAAMEKAIDDCDFESLGLVAAKGKGDIEIFKVTNCRSAMNI